VAGKVTPPPLDPNSALFLDVDGTLLEIAARPELVLVPPGLPELLARLAKQRAGALALISGRTLANLDRLFLPWRGAASGLHGAERRRADGSLAASGRSAADQAAAEALERLRPSLADIAGARPGAWLEDKGRTLALHYRSIPQQEPEIRRAVQCLAQRESEALRLIAGKMVLELQPRHYDKGAVIAAFFGAPPFRGRRPVFIGDDTTDEDGFAEVNRRGGVSIRVGDRSAATAAAYALPSVAEVRRWLATADKD
jgi:trehalose 6-phosphate phosphatase